MIAPDRQPGPIMLPHRPTTVRQLLQPGRTSGNLIYFVRQSGFTNNAAPVAEGAQKPESNIVFTPDTAKVSTIAHWIPVSRQAFDDVPALESLVDGELRYGLDGKRPRTLDEVGRTFNVTRERIRQIENQGLKKLRALADAYSFRDVA